MQPQIVIPFLSLLTLFSNIALLILIFFFLLEKIIKKDFLKPILVFLRKKALVFALVVSLTAALGSLYFSEVVHFEPCKLCWFQRIFMYPLPIILEISIRNRLEEIWRIVLPLSLIGGLIAIYHYYFQISGNPLIPCSAVGFSVSCSERFFTYFGYITIPWMSFSAFTLVSLFAYFSKNTNFLKDRKRG